MYGHTNAFFFSNLFLEGLLLSCFLFSFLDNEPLLKYGLLLKQRTRSWVVDGDRGECVCVYGGGREGV